MMGPDPAQVPQQPDAALQPVLGTPGFIPPKARVHPLQGIHSPCSWEDVGIAPSPWGTPGPRSPPGDCPQGRTHITPVACSPASMSPSTWGCAAPVLAPTSGQDPSCPPTMALRDSEWSPSPVPPCSPLLPVQLCPLTLLSLPLYPAELSLTPQPARTGDSSCPQQQSCGTPRLSGEHPARHRSPLAPHGASWSAGWYVRGGGCS